MKNPFLAKLSGFHFAFAERIDFVRSDHWDAVARHNSFFISRAFLSLVERCGPSGMDHRYAVIYDADQPVALVSAQILPVSSEQLVNESSLGRKRRKALAQIRERLFIAGNVFSWGAHGIAFAPGFPTEKLWPAVAEAIYRIRRADKLEGPTDFVLIKDIPETEHGVQVLRRLDYRPLKTEPNMVLRLSPAWKTYDDYLNSMVAKYRRSQKVIHEAIQAAGVTVEVVGDLRPWAEKVNALYHQVLSNASVRLASLPSHFLPELGQVAGDRFRAMLLRKEDQLVGFVTMIKDGETAVGYYIGFDRSFSTKASLYLRLLHGVIEQAITWRCTTLSLGRTALEPKAALGAKPEAMAVWVKHANPILNLAIRQIVKRIPHSEAPDRSPFKDIPA